ncbi:hypothetical protein P7K49_000078 [Saguinus oedipus]|uniref:Uncharacterized protein n=1 Tax=Saguinus oedipus TaxID=9490 RepID=A0ABQ9WAQ2_SAGOE|nr:hypothetical protein P7K49_000078 [Saguinus oedipus]
MPVQTTVLEITESQDEGTVCPQKSGIPGPPAPPQPDAMGGLQPGPPPTFLLSLQGYAAEMDNPLMAHLLSTGLHNKKDVLFGNMEEIYHFHNRHAPVIPLG